MTIDWNVIAQIVGPVIGVLVGVALDRFVERRPRLIAYSTHASAFNLPGPPAGPPSVTVHTHGIVIRNTGRRAASDVRVRHHQLPDHRVFPNIAYTVQPLPTGGTELVFPTLVPGEQVTISYLYGPPLFAHQIHDGIRHSEGFAREVTVVLRQNLVRSCLATLPSRLTGEGLLARRGFMRARLSTSRGRRRSRTIRQRSRKSRSPFVPRVEKEASSRVGSRDCREARA